MKPVVFKLGGSLLSEPQDGRLRRWCTHLTTAWAGRAVIVPGGGAFADAVRDAQSRWRFSDDGAHRMALRAMDQCGLMLCDLFPALQPVDDPDALPGVCASGRTPVWLAARALDHCTGFPRDWTVTSDSIAVWLAGRLGGTRTVLVKSCALPDGDLATLAAAGIVDGALPDMAASTSVPVHVVNADDPLPLP